MLAQLVTDVALMRLTAGNARAVNINKASGTNFALLTKEVRELFKRKTEDEAMKLRRKSMVLQLNYASRAISDASFCRLAHEQTDRESPCSCGAARQSSDRRTCSAELDRRCGKCRGAQAAARRKPVGLQFRRPILRRPRGRDIGRVSAGGSVLSTLPATLLINLIDRLSAGAST
ncbi:hypothetical protein [Bradyrhizobium sp. CCBAU 51753]|uniref:hypothetical protein n=1 Tax=Bradyrhizobium sp. CCBAU 51753 TaxID=1325100 RepID=UPI00188D483B|nr:hypothetical protein [Bradyrhizobium sp. CCBAU 51753]